MGVWIETLRSEMKEMINKSHPAWVCGLKRLCTLVKRGKGLSHPAWVCGLKHILNTLQMYKKVTPCVGVWIETYSEHIANVQKGHTLRGCVD